MKDPSNANHSLRNTFSQLQPDEQIQRRGKLAVNSHSITHHYKEFKLQTPTTQRKTVRPHSVDKISRIHHSQMNTRNNSQGLKDFNEFCIQLQQPTHPPPQKSNHNTKSNFFTIQPGSPQIRASEKNQNKRLSVHSTLDSYHRPEEGAAIISFQHFIFSIKQQQKIKYIQSNLHTLNLHADKKEQTMNLVVSGNHKSLSQKYSEPKREENSKIRYFKKSKRVSSPPKVLNNNDTSNKIKEKPKKQQQSAQKVDHKETIPERKQPASTNPQQPQGPSPTPQQTKSIPQKKSQTAYKNFFSHSNDIQIQYLSAQNSNYERPPNPNSSPPKLFINPLKHTIVNSKLFSPFTIKAINFQTKTQIKTTQPHFIEGWKDNKETQEEFDDIYHHL